MEHEYNKEAVLLLLSMTTERRNDLPFWHWHCFISRAVVLMEQKINARQTMVKKGGKSHEKEFQGGKVGGMGNGPVRGSGFGGPSDGVVGTDGADGAV
jgi:hypothetical protein